MNSTTFNWLRHVFEERFGLLFQFDRLEDKLVRLRIPGIEGSIDIVADNATFTRTDSDLVFCSWNAEPEGWSSCLTKPIPAPGVSGLPCPLIERSKSGHCIRYDILGLTYWMLSRQEEVGRTDLDAHNRFLATSSHAFRHGYLERPIVDEWLDILGQVIQKQWPTLALKKHKFQMMVSHDVDTPSRYWFVQPKQLLRGMIADAFKRGNIRRAAFAPWIRLNSGQVLHSADPCNTFNWIMNVSEQYGLTSAFYFICGRTDPDMDAVYELEQPAIRDLIRRIHARGHEIGLHPSYNTYQSPPALLAESQRLRQVCAEEGVKQDEYGGRMHCLRWEHPTTLYGWEQAGMKYDSTMSYADRAGFRCGTCFEYPAFDPVAGRALNLRIRPLIAMECTVMSERYMGLGSTELALNKFKDLKDACRGVDGCFTLLWHNSELMTQSAKDLYVAVLES
jgi:hypothetical protein